MSNELTLFSFEDELEVQPFGQGYNYEILEEGTRDFVIQKTDETHGLLKRTAQNIIKIGQNLIAVKAKLPHGQYLPWLKAEFGMSDWSARSFVNVAKRLENKSEKISDLPVSIIYELGAPSTSDEVIEGVLSGQIDPTLEAIRAEKEAEKQRADEEERLRKELEQEFTLFKNQTRIDLEQAKGNLTAKENELKLTQENKKLQEDKVKALEDENKRIKEEKTQVVKEDTEETKANLEAREKEIKEAKAKLEELEKAEKQLKADKKTLSDEATKLAAELKKQANENAAIARQERYENRVKEQCRKSNETIQKSITQYVGQLPTAQASQVYTFDEWAQLDQTDKLLDYCKEAIAHAKQEARNSQLIDANPSNGLVVYDSQEPHAIESDQSHAPAIEHFATDIDFEVLFAQYQQYVKTFPEEKLWWRAPQCGIKDMEMDRDLHIHYTRELLKSGDPYRITAAIEGMRRTLGYGATA